MKKDNTMTVFYDEKTRKDIYRLNGVDVTDTIEMLKDKWERQILDTRCRLFQMDMSIQQRLQDQIADLEAKLAELEKKNDKLGTDLCNAENIVSDLQSQLAEKDREIERLKQNYDEVWEDTYFSVKEDFELNNNCNECRRYYAEELNKQLAEKDRAIESLEELNKSLGQTCNNDLKEIERLREQLAESEEQIKMLEEHKFYADNIIQAYADKCKNADQDKISFCIEQLEKVKEKTKIYFVKATHKHNEYYSAQYNMITDFDLCFAIDNQIKQLKGGK